MYIMIMYYDDSGNSASKFAKVETEVGLMTCAALVPH